MDLIQAPGHTLDCKLDKTIRQSSGIRCSRERTDEYSDLTMNRNEMIQSLQAEVTKLQRVLDLLLDPSSDAEGIRRPGRPKGSGKKVASVAPEELAPKKRTMSAEGKARIAAAQKKRWAAQTSTSPGRVVRKKAAATKKTIKAVPPKSARKVTTAPVKKSAAAGRKNSSEQPALAKRVATKASRKDATKKRVATKTPGRATKRPTKQLAPAGPEVQTTT